MSIGLYSRNLIYCSTDIQEGDYILVMNGENNIPALIVDKDEENQIVSCVHFVCTNQKSEMFPDARLYKKAEILKDGAEVNFMFEYGEVVLKLPKPKVHKKGRHREYFEFAIGDGAQGI